MRAILRVASPEAEVDPLHVALVLAELRVHPVKSCRGISLAASDVDRFGLALDRAFMIVDAEHGVFLTQRDEPRLARIATHLEAGALVLCAPGVASLRIDLTQRDRPRRPVQVWRHQGEGVDQGDPAAGWLSDLLGRPLRLVRTPPDHARRVNPERSPEPAWTSFTDGYPFLVLSQASLDGLNARLAVPLPIERFRPNLVIGGALPHAEDGWRRIRIGALELDVVKPCERCAITTVDQEKGVRDGAEPLRTLARYRRHEGSVLFGQNAVHRSEDRLEVGMPVEVVSTQPPPAFDRP